MLAQPPEESRRVAEGAKVSPTGRDAAPRVAVGGVCEDEESAACPFLSDVAAVSSSIGVSCEFPRTEEEFERGGMDPET